MRTAAFLAFALASADAQLSCTSLVSTGDLFFDQGLQECPAGVSNCVQLSTGTGGNVVQQCDGAGDNSSCDQFTNSNGDGCNTDAGGTALQVKCSGADFGSLSQDQLDASLATTEAAQCILDLGNPGQPSTLSCYVAASENGGNFEPGIEVACAGGVTRCVALYTGTDGAASLLGMSCDEEDVCGDYSNADDPGCTVGAEEFADDDDISANEGAILCTTASLGALTRDELLERMLAIPENQCSGAGSAALSVTALAAVVLSYLSAQ